VLGAALIIAAILMFACSSGPTVHPAPCCGEEGCDTYESEVIESIEEPDLTRDYEEPQTGSFDFPMHGEPVGLEGYCACVCCGVYIIDDPDIITEHLKTCCP